MPRSHVALCLTLAASALLLGGCEDKEAQDKARAAEARATAAEEQRSEQEAARKDADVREADAKKALGDAQSELASVQSKIATLEADLAKAKTKPKEMEKDLKEVTGHRDELVEWIEKELLPAAESCDVRLVNLKNATEEMQREVGAVRKLEWKHPVMRRLVTRAQVGEWMRRDLKKEMPEDEAKKIVATGAEMGLLKPGTDLYQMFAQFMEAGAAAFYKPDTKTFYHIEGNDGRGAYPVVFHELVHAMEDQHYALDKLSKIERDSDRQLAIKGLVEGTASLYGEVYEKAHPEDRKAMMKSQMTPALIQKQQKMMMTVPTFFIAMMALYPYNNGKEFVRAMGAEDPAAADALFADPPVSTEQILHPEKFKERATRDYPRAVGKPALGDQLGEGWTEIDDDTMGELMIGALLATLRSGNQPMMTLQSLADQSGGVGFKAPVRDAVEGWDGDRYAAFVHDDGKGGTQCCMVWSTVWDSEKDAVQFVDTYAPLLAKKVTGAKPDGLPADLRFVEPASGRVSALERRGARVVAVLGSPREKADACLKAGFDAPVTADARDAADKN